MKRINNSDVNILLNPKYINIDNFNITFFTVNPELFYIRKNQNDVVSVEREASEDDYDVIRSGGTTVTDYYIKLDWNELVTLGKGILQYLVTNNILDTDRADNYYNKLFERTTEYYINSNVIVDEESAKSINEVIGELGIKIDGEITRSTSADTEHLTAINNEIITRQNQVNQLLELYNEFPNDYYTKAYIDALEAQINALVNYINNLTSNNVNQLHLDYNEDSHVVSFDCGLF